MRYLLGIDIGTSSAKSVLMEDSGLIAAIGRQAYDFDIPRPGWAEQEPEVWWEAAKQAVAQALHISSVPAVNIAAIGFSGQMHGPVLLDRSGASVRPAIIWADQRSLAERQQIYERCGQAGLAQHIGNPVDTGFMLASLLWLKTHEPHHYARLHQVLLPKDYVRYRLTGELCMDPSDAGGTSCYDVRQRQWARAMCAELGIAPDIFPPVLDSSAIAGTVSPRAAAEIGLPSGIPVVTGGSDQAMGALASGIIRPGPVLLMIGTGATLFSTIDSALIDPELRLHTYPHCLPNAWHLLGAILAGGVCMKWLRNVLKLDPGFGYDAMTREAADIPVGAEGAIFLPYLAGERTPHMDSSAQGVLFGLTLSHTRGHLIRAVMEGVVLALRDGLELFKTLGVRPQEIVTGGGGASNPLWRQMQADILGLPVRTIPIQEKSATGAAMIAGIGRGIFESFEDACQRIIVPGECTTPLPAHIQQYDEVYQVYHSLYPRLREAFTANTKYS